ncbi:SDR family oxidoreductase [Streptomyces sp. CA-278952]|uniref:SDR family oxidoreductase n=1 Tax=unclassified Streptomyces TaxID=2593676 RepID=UPI0023679F73|nr:SDR family oxidoreductase [Streptomyces sp. CA-278952]WDG33054.1 SDR family oxidoreductase [Streptomyces sp. CA-278952]
MPSPGTPKVVVHAAADVRLVAPPEELERVNHDGVRRRLAWIDAEAMGGVRFHHISTLAVAGGIDPAAPNRRFSEADLRIGQHFRTPYERSKSLAEEAVRAWAASGRRCHIHRSGHVAAHSRTGAFHGGIATNRVYQTLRGYLPAGAAPRLEGRRSPSVTWTRWPPGSRLWPCTRTRPPGPTMSRPRTRSPTTNWWAG